MESCVMCQSNDYTNSNAHYIVMIPMLHGDKTNATSRLHSTSQTEENILPRGIFFLKYKILDIES
jgi:hypothetical protein